MLIHSASALLIHSCIDRLATDGDATVELTATIERLEQLHCSEVAGLQANLRKHLEELSGVRFRYEKERCCTTCGIDERRERGEARGKGRAEQSSGYVTLRFVH
ncbi:predicted protein [Histoplasma capsulatum H143]|uniref:Uncharacterized protein n=1 Tax=Ajellomyces capsulatus (strain H143) TaxID=544712 RepID=C6HC49_AJECH|nr:predicted protein [Histoplasma capsulatum H143]